METAKLVTVGNKQAVHLPESFRFEGNEVVVKRFGKAVLLLPVYYSAAELKSLLDDLDVDFNLVREQPVEQQKRDFD
ncbi:MAG: AbrB/MazE/SpoVT family DNA-binding domain-containing protein [Aestuariibacter sp.]|nr:AbrB/MazE/SpoVT family DNA-binding domain-containing protein [Aestuariibacter sp.]